MIGALEARTDRDEVLDVARDALLEGRHSEAESLLRQVMTAPEARYLVGGAPRVGDIVSSSWGYDQTNVDFYLVGKVGKSMITLHPIGSVRIGGSLGSDYVVPDASRANPRPRETIRRKYTVSDQSLDSRPLATRHRGPSGDYYYTPSRGYRCSISDFSSGSLWHGRPMHQTAAGFGH